MEFCFRNCWLSPVSPLWTLQRELCPRFAEVCEPEAQARVSGDDPRLRFGLSKNKPSKESPRTGLLKMQTKRFSALILCCLLSY